MLKGYRTYCLAGLGVIVVVLGYFKVLDADITTKLLEILGFGSLAALRAAK